MFNPEGELKQVTRSYECTRDLCELLEVDPLAFITAVSLCLYDHYP